MLNIDDLWIGDLLLLKKSGRIGKFNGRSGYKKIKVQIGEKNVITPIGNVKLAPEGTNIETYDYSHRPKIEKQKVTELSASIDLHIEVLNPSLKNGRAERIVDFQVKAAEDFIENAIANSTKQVLIIHGKGEGVLKLEIAHLLSLSEDVQFTFEKNNGGATEVWFK
jgi:dsDNA-specific endonuclease/ATPase MutS2